VRCKKCNCVHHHRHGYFFRKATHRRFKAIQVLRCLCLSCRCTFGVLPQDLVPVMRWTLASVRHASCLLKHMSTYCIATILRVWLGAFQRLARKLPRLGQKI
jgi:prepilin signal peptidase PulO-like enzyme (type II secretory pathway)